MELFINRFDFQTKIKISLIRICLPGPQTESVNKSFSVRMDRLDRMAQLGFIVITLGNRGGHPDRSKWYHNYGYGNLRDYGLADKKYVAQQLANRHDFIDINRVGIYGHSGGGFMSTAAILVCLISSKLRILKQETMITLFIIAGGAKRIMVF